MDINAEEIVVSDDWAYSRGTFTVDEAVEGKFLTIFRRQEDGSWRIYRDSVSSIVKRNTEGRMMYPSVSKRRTVSPCQDIPTSRPRREIGSPV
jgi:hypothetical protein